MKPLQMFSSEFCKIFQRRIQNPVKHLRSRFLQKLRLNTVTYFCIKLHFRCSVAFWIRPFFRKSNSGWLILILTNLDKISIILRFFFLIEISQGVRPCLSTDLNALTAPGWWRRYSASFEKLYLAQKWSNVQDGVSGSKWDNHKINYEKEAYIL